MKVSEERLKELVGASGLEPCDFEPVWDSLMVGEVVSMARELLALRNAREGWKLVPVEPDWEMLSADGCKEHHNGQPCLHHDNRKRIWSAMLAAAPSPHE